MATALVLGATGMVGTHILSTLRTAAPNLKSITTITRRDPPTSPSSSVPTNSHTNPETTTWTTTLKSLTPVPSIIFSSLATTRAAAGSFETQYKLEHDLNIELAQAAKSRGAKVYVLISGAGASTSSTFAYSRMKGEIEEHIKELDFDHTVIVRPGLIAGRREETRYAEGVIRGVAALAGRVSNSLKDFWAQDAEVIARAAVSAGLKALEEGGEKVVIVGQSDIIRLGRTEWKGL